MAQDKTNVVIIQVERSGGVATAGGETPMFRLRRGDYDETIAALRAAGFQVVDSIQDAFDAAELDEG